MADEEGQSGEDRKEGGGPVSDSLDADRPKPDAFLSGVLWTLFFWLYLILAAWVGNGLGVAGRAGFDAVNFHVPTIKQFCDQLPLPDFRDYLSATTPGFHYFLALFGHTAPTGFGIATFGLILVQFCSVGLLEKLSRYRWYLSGNDETVKIDQSTATTWAFTLCVIAPLLTSVYVFTSSVWLLPDNAAWCWVAAMLVFSMNFRSHWAAWIGAAVSLALLVFTRQIHLWAAAPLVVAAWMSAGIQSGLPVRLNQTHETGWTWRELLFTQLDRRIKRAAIAVVCTLPAFALVGYFVHLWGGLTPPTFQGQYPVDMSKPPLLRLINAPAAPAFVLAMFGVFGSFFAAWWGPAAIRGLKHSRGRFVLIVGAVFGLLAAVIPATTYSMADGRWSGLWNIAAKLPTVGHTSLLIAACSTLGGVIVGAMMLGMRVNQAAVVFTSIVGFAAAQMASFQLWQRYNEPFVLIMLILCCGPLLSTRDVTEPAKPLSAAWWWRLRVAGPVVLAVLLGAVTVNELSKAEPQKDLKLQPGTERTKEFLRTGVEPA